MELIECKLTVQAFLLIAAHTTVVTPQDVNLIVKNITHRPERALDIKSDWIFINDMVL